MQLDKQSLETLALAVAKLSEGFENLPEFSDVSSQADSANIQKVLLEVAERMQDNYPYMHPFYAGQMLKPPHKVARLAYSLALFINPNNHALDGGIASSALEKEAVAEIASMFGFERHLGHLTSGGTMANLEALWVASRLKPGELVLASSQAHYTHSRITGVLGIAYQAVAVDKNGCMDMDDLQRQLEDGQNGVTARVGTVVATLGTTSIGAVDPLAAIIQLRNKYNFRIHIDSAYGGYFKLASNLAPAATTAYKLTHEADSIVVDPHKHGLQPYGCGCVLFKDPSVGALYKHDSPYTYFSSAELHLGEISLECSRAGASAVALWATQRFMPLVLGGEFAHGLEDSRRAALAFYQKLSADSRFIAFLEPQLDIVVYAVKAETASQSSKLAREIFENAARHNLHLALAALPSTLVAQGQFNDQETVTCLRSCLMKPEHLHHLDQIWQLLLTATDEVISSQPLSGLAS